MSVAVNPIVEAFTAAINGAAQFFASLVTEFFNAMTALGVPGILATVAALGIITYAFARITGVDIFGMVRNLVGGLVGRLTGGL